MPIITNKTIFSYSSEDSTFSAKNLLDNHKTARWKCATAGEKFAFVVLKFDKPYLISKIDIGNEHSGLMQFSVAKSEQDPPDFKELILSTSFMTEKEVRNDLNPHRIRFFEKSSMLESVANQRFDLIRIKCTQPYTNRWKYGISFITIYTSDEVAESKVERPVIVRSSVSTPKSSTKEIKPEPKLLSSSSSSLLKKSPKKMIGKFAFRDSSPSDDENHDTSPYLQWKKKKMEAKNTEKDTRKRIRSLSDSSGDDKNSKHKTKQNRNRTKGLMYDSDDDAPNERLQKKIDKDRKEKDKNVISSSLKTKPMLEKLDKSPTSKFASFLTSDVPSKSTSSYINKKTLPLTKALESTSKPPTKKSSQYKPFNKLLEDVTFVMSGYQNPERANLRQKAIDMGARYKADWEDSCCTHLICAFVNTPKFNQVKGKGKIVTKKWIESCFSEQKKIPWRRFATDRDEKNADESEEEILCEWKKRQALDIASNSDDDDMLVVDNRNKKTKSFKEEKATPEEKETVKQESNDDDDDMVVVDKRNRKESVEDNLLKLEPTHHKEMEEDTENLRMEIDSDGSIDITAVECEAFKNKVFYLNEDLPSSTVLKFKHIIRNMLGIVTNNPSTANYIITKYGRNLPKTISAEVVKDIWIQECHDLQAFIPTMRYQL